jgi:hypothetical protein
MSRALLTALTLALFPLGSRGEEAALHLTVTPMPAPKPALRYQLLPEVRELNPGNAAQNYLRCFMPEGQFFFAREAAALRDRYLTMPLSELAAAKPGEYGGSALRQADWAARLDTLDWQARYSVQAGGMDTLPAELGPLQVLASALQARFRCEVAGRHFDDAIRTAKTMFALGRHLGEHPTEVADLVGLWVAHLCLCTLEEMVQQPACPNLYWALTDLPCPLVDLRKGAQGDRARVAAALQPLRDDMPMTESQMEQLVIRLSGVMGFGREQAGHAPQSVRVQLRAKAGDPERRRAARQRLIEAGYGADLVATFPPSQVILLDERRDYEIQRDERIKLLALPLWQMDTLRGACVGATGEDGMFAELLPQILKLRLAQGRLEQQVALLRHVEALRLHAAEHGGRLPAKLTEVSVPLPADPVTGNPFDYALERATAHIRGSSFQGDDRDREYCVHYAVTIPK